ncbi:MAG: Zn-ribbon domain-containing OB-fold protein [Burkholderiales bacterium]
MALMAQDRKIPAPAVNAEVKPFFDAAAEGRLLLKKCADCGESHFYPRAICPHCFSANTTWIDARGTGTIHTYSVLRRGVPVPYCIAYVTLDEGVSMISNIVDCDLDAVRIGQPVRVVFKPTEGGPPVPMFTPVAEAR